MRLLLRRTLLSGVFATLTLVTAMHAGPGNTLPAFPLYERFLAIDGACGWPRLSVLPDGELSMIVWPNPYHGYIEGAVECWNSRDDGRTWQRAGVPVPWSPGQNRMNLAAGVTPDGVYVALVSGWDNRLPATWTASSSEESDRVGRTMYRDAHTLDPVPAISRDGGRTWQQFPALDAPRQSNGNALTPYGPIAPLANGELGVILYGDRVHFYTSADGGKTWRERGRFSEHHAHNETAWLRLADGDLLAAARTEADGHVDAFRSRDGGATWIFEGPLTLPGQHPADLTALPDGRLLLSYGVRNEGLWAICARYGDAEGKTWSSPRWLVDLEGSTDDPFAAKPGRDGGYPSTVVARDGTLVTAYYSRGNPVHFRYHVGVVRWKPEPAQ